jgi:hypothetical protein
VLSGGWARLGYFHPQQAIHSPQSSFPFLPPLQSPGRRPNAPATVRSVHNRVVFQIEPLPPPAGGGAVVSSISQDRYLAVTGLPASLLDGISSSGSSSGAGGGGPAAGAKAAGPARGSESDSWRDAAVPAPPPAPQPRQQPPAAAAAHSAWRVAGLGGYAYCCAATRAAKGGRALLAVACGDKTVRVVTVARGSSSGETESSSATAASAADGGAAAAPAAPAVPPPVADRSKEALVIWQGLQDKAVALQWHPNNPGEPDGRAANCFAARHR